MPLTWRADWPDCKPVESLVHRGTDVELQPTWYVNGAAAATNGWTFTTYVQTNAVGQWFGPLPGAAFSHTNDVGAAFYSVMVRAQGADGGVNYTAFARFRMLESPGFTPGELPLPAKTIDFADVTVLNAPWPDASITNGFVTAAAATNIAEAVAGSATNALDVSFSSRLSRESQNSTNYTDSAIAAATNNLASASSLTNYATRAQLEAGWWSEWVISSSDYPNPIPSNWRIFWDDTDGWIYDFPGISYYNPSPIDFHGSSRPGKDVDELSFDNYADPGEPVYSFTASRRRVAAPVPTKPEDIGAASTNDVQLTPIYSQTPTFSEWTIMRDDEDVTAQVQQPVYEEFEGYWQVFCVEGDNPGASQFDEPIDINRLTWSDADGIHSYIATRTRTDAIGYTLGDQTDKPLQSKGDYTLLSQLYEAVRNLAPDFAAKIYALNELCTYNGVFYRCKSAYTATASSAKPDADTTHWEAKNVSELFLPLTGGRMTDSLYIGTDGVIGINAEGKPFLMDSGLAVNASFADIIDTANGDSPYYAKPSDIGIPAFSTAKTYALGAKVVYDNALWNCTTAVATAGAWNAANWTKICDLATDATPTANSKALMTSGDIKTALDAKADAAKCQYPFNTATVTLSTTTDTNDTAAVTGIVDHGKNAATLASTVTVATITIPARTDGYTGDLFLSLSVVGSAPSITFTDAATSADLDIIFGEAQLADIDKGRNLILFSEVEEGKWKVAVEHEDFPEVTP